MTHAHPGRLAGALVLLTALPLLAASPADEKTGHARRQPDMSQGVATEHTATGDTQAAWWSFFRGSSPESPVDEGPRPDAIVPEVPYHEPTK